METKKASARSYYIIWGLALAVVIVLAVSTFRLMGLPPDPPGPGVDEPLAPLDTPREEIDQSPPPDRIEEMPPGQEIDEQPFERPPGAIPADPRRPATVPKGAPPRGDGGARLEEEEGMEEEMQVRSVPKDLQRVERGEEDGKNYDDYDDYDDHEELQDQHEELQDHKEIERTEVGEEEGWEEVEWEEEAVEWEEPGVEGQASQELWGGDQGLEEQEAYDDGVVARESSEEAFAGYQDFLDESGIPESGGAGIYSSMATQQAAEALYRLAMQGGSSLEMAARSHDEVMDAHDEEFADIEEDVEEDVDGSGQDESVEEEEEEVEASVWVKTADWLREIQEESFPDLGEMVSDVEDAAWAIDSEVPRSEQVDELVAFYSIMEDTLEQMVGVELDPDLGI